MDTPPPTIITDARALPAAHGAAPAAQRWSIALDVSGLPPAALAVIAARVARCAGTIDELTLRALTDAGALALAAALERAGGGTRVRAAALGGGGGGGSIRNNLNDFTSSSSRATKYQNPSLV